MGFCPSFDSTNWIRHNEATYSVQPLLLQPSITQNVNGTYEIKFLFQFEIRIAVLSFYMFLFSADLAKIL